MTLAAGSLAAVGCDRAPDHTLNQPVVVHPPSPPREINVPATPPPTAPDAGVAAERPSAPPMGMSVNNPPTAPRAVVADAGVAPVRVAPGLEGIQMPQPTSNPPGPVILRLPPGNG